MKVYLERYWRQYVRGFISANWSPALFGSLVLFLYWSNTLATGHEADLNSLSLATLVLGMMLFLMSSLSIQLTSLLIHRGVAKLVKTRFPHLWSDVLRLLDSSMVWGLVALLLGLLGFIQVAPEMERLQPALVFLLGAALSQVGRVALVTRAIAMYSAQEVKRALDETERVRLGAKEASRFFRVDEGGTSD